jgi:hypothetical protein
MAEQYTFDERVKKVIIDEAMSYKKYFVDYEYLVCSENFVHSKYYIIDARESNYKHLTGVNSDLPASEFFDKCLSGTLALSDFDYMKQTQNQDNVKGSVRRKIKALPEVSHLFQDNVMVEEDFKKNRICCAFAVGKKACTIGFHIAGKARPMTLLKGYELNDRNAKPVSLVLRKKAGADKFDEIIHGTPADLIKYQPSIKNMLSAVLLDKMHEEEVKLMLIRTLELELSGKTARNIQNAKIFLTFQNHMARIIHRFQNQQ